MNKMFIINEYARGRVDDIDDAPEEVRGFIEKIEAHLAGEAHDAEIASLIRSWTEAQFMRFEEEEAPALIEAAFRLNQGGAKGVQLARAIVQFLTALDSAKPLTVPYGMRNEYKFWSIISDAVKRRIAEGRLKGRVEEVVYWWVKNHPSYDFANGSVSSTFGNLAAELSDEAIRFLATFCGYPSPFWEAAMRRQLPIWAATEKMRVEIARAEQLRKDEEIIPGLREMMKLPTREFFYAVANWWRETEPRPPLDTVVEIAMRYVKFPLTRRGRWGDEEDYTEEFLRRQLTETEEEWEQ